MYLSIVYTTQAFGEIWEFVQDLPQSEELLRSASNYLLYGIDSFFKSSGMALSTII
jgi:hypothetical protein